MKITVFGAGAIGGYLAVPLAEAGHEISLVARGPHLAAIQADGLTLETAESTRTIRLPANDDPSVFGPQDVVFVTLKAHSIPAVVPAIRELLGPETMVVSAVNGIPWWYFHGLPGDFAERHVEAVDPEGVIWNGIGAERAIGCVVYPSTEITAPGHIRHLADNKLTLGEPSGERSERVKALSKALIEAGFKAPVRPRIRDEIWVKLWGNLSFNPLSALTLATLDTLATSSRTRPVARAMMHEAQCVGERLGVRFAVDIERRIDGAAEVGAHRTSMLQDLEADRPLETGALVGAVQELGQTVGVATPTIDLVMALLAERIASRDAGSVAA